MFTGIVEGLGEVVAVESRSDGAVLRIRAKLDGAIPHGASVAINGACLTVVDDVPDGEARVLSFDVMAETLKRTALGKLDDGEPVNVERAVRADGRLDGHVVQGHIDGTGSVVSRESGEVWDSVRFALPLDLARYVAEKGSIAVDGVSLTVTAVGDDWFEVGLIPETLRATTLGNRAPGDEVNLEVDVLAKYAERLLSRTEK
jgi:riboflavin synthase